jgi:hypothetical protein
MVSARRDGGPERPAARRFPAVDLRHGAQRRHRARLDRRHPPGPAGGPSFAADGKVKATVSVEPLENINDIFQRMHRGQIEGRIVMTI